VIVFLGIFGAQQQVDRLAELELQVTTGREHVQVVDILARAGVNAIAVMVLVVNRDATQRRVRQRPADRRVHPIAQVAAANRHIGVAREVLRRLGGDQVDRAAGRIAPVQRTLRTAQRLDALQIEQRCELRRGLRDHGAIDVQRHRRVDPGERTVQADAADEQLGEAEVVAESDARHVILQILDALDVAVEQIVRRDRGDRDADILERLLTFLRRHDDFFQLSRRHRERRRECQDHSNYRVTFE
jgi:hypothetical protein